MSEEIVEICSDCGRDLTEDEVSYCCECGSPFCQDCVSAMGLCGDCEDMVGEEICDGCGDVIIDESIMCPRCMSMVGACCWDQTVDLCVYCAGEDILDG